MDAVFSVFLAVYWMLVGWVKWVKYGGDARRMWCDMTTDGGGWVLISTQKPDGKLRNSGAAIKGYVAGPNRQENQRYNDPTLAKLGSQGRTPFVCLGGLCSA